jgi:RNA polymerase subunit RPABC4/transcription elongation factor Spt4
MKAAWDEVVIVMILTLEATWLRWGQRMNVRRCERCRFILPNLGHGSRWCPHCTSEPLPTWHGIVVGLAVAGMATWLLRLWVLG